MQGIRAAYKMSTGRPFNKALEDGSTQYEIPWTRCAYIKRRIARKNRHYSKVILAQITY